MASTTELLAELEDKLILGEILESDYKELKWKLIKEARDRGEELAPVSGMVTRTETRDKLGKVFCYVDAGPFLYGPDDEYAETKAAYYISKYPVTVKDWLAFLDDSKYDYPEEDLNELLMISPDHNCPVVHVSWEDCKEYCRWIRKQTGEYYSLPHETEWEKAARGVDGRFYPWGNDAPSETMACFQDEAMPRHCTMPVNAHEANRSPYGLMDMVGNVWEWCLDRVDDPRDPHILRGGSWCNDIDFCNALSRTFSHPSTKRVDFGGFRLLYLPHDLNAEYRKEYGGQGAQQEKMSLKVVRLPKDRLVKKDAPVGEQTTSGLSAKIAAAAEKAESRQSDATPTGQLSRDIDSLLEEHRQTKDFLDEARKQFEGAKSGVPEPAAEPSKPASLKRKPTQKPERMQATPVARRPGSTSADSKSAALSTAPEAAGGLEEASELDEMMAQAISQAAGQFAKARDPEADLKDRLAKVRAAAAVAGEEEITFLDVETKDDDDDGQTSGSKKEAAARQSAKSGLEFDALWTPGDSYEPIIFSNRTTNIGRAIWFACVICVFVLLYLRFAGIGA